MSCSQRQEIGQGVHADVLRALYDVNRCGSLRVKSMDVTLDTVLTVTPTQSQTHKRGARTYTLTHLP